MRHLQRCLKDVCLAMIVCGVKLSLDDPKKQLWLAVFSREPIQLCTNLVTTKSGDLCHNHQTLRGPPRCSSLASRVWFRRPLKVTHPHYISSHAHTKCAARRCGGRSAQGHGRPYSCSRGLLQEHCTTCLNNFGTQPILFSALNISMLFLVKLVWEDNPLPAGRTGPPTSQTGSCGCR